MDDNSFSRIESVRRVCFVGSEELQSRWAEIVKSLKFLTRSARSTQTNLLWTWQSYQSQSPSSSLLAPFGWILLGKNDSFASWPVVSFTCLNLGSVDKHLRTLLMPSKPILRWGWGKDSSIDYCSEWISWDFTYALQAAPRLSYSLQHSVVKSHRSVYLRWYRPTLLYTMLGSLIARLCEWLVWLAADIACKSRLPNQKDPSTVRKGLCCNKDVDLVRRTAWRLTLAVSLLPWTY